MHTMNSWVNSLYPWIHQLIQVETKNLLWQTDRQTFAFLQSLLGTEKLSTFGKIKTPKSCASLPNCEPARSDISARMASLSILEGVLDGESTVTDSEAGMGENGDEEESRREFEGKLLTSWHWTWSSVATKIVRLVEVECDKNIFNFCGNFTLNLSRSVKIFCCSCNICNMQTLSKS